MPKVEKLKELENKLWESATELWGSIDPAKYKDIVLGILFLKYVSDAFEKRRKQLLEEIQDPESEYFTEDEKEKKEILEDKDEYISQGIFYIPEKARWEYLINNATSEDIPKLLDEAMIEIENENPSLKGVLPKEFVRSEIPPEKLGRLLNIFNNIHYEEYIENKDESIGDVFGTIYGYFMRKFSQKLGQKGGEFFTPESIVKLMVELIEPMEGRIYDPACGSGGMFVQSAKFVKRHKGKPLSIYGQESNPATVRICKMNLAIHGLPFENIKQGDTLANDLHKALKADYILTNPPFNYNNYNSQELEGDVRFKYGVVPKDPNKAKSGNANFLWIQHFIYHLADNGICATVMANGSLSAGGKEGEIRKAIIEDDLVDCIIALPPKMFYTVQIPACIWILTKNKADKRFRNRKGETLFIDARELYNPVSRNLNEFTDEHIQKIASTYRSYRGEKGYPEYKDIEGFCKVATIDEIKEHDYILTPGRYVGIAEIEEDSEPFEEKMARLTKELSEQFKKSRELEEKIKQNLAELGFKIE
ncbi:class I SAM-dependent DNA methyltransferase [Persephonella sp.]|uniref:type I restriction-modification system subunit M n=1 Tax=Persephonella sp. TaxID=2060922 RepID=UPI0026361003|nr:class I SAM-dependent DNA methyltransferase [Persephonella sp.]